MKKERRHELQTNWLADWLGHQLEAIRPYTQVIVGGAILVIALVVVIAVWMAQTSDPWMAFTMVAQQPSPNPDALREVGNVYGDTQAGLWAQQKEADTYLAEGSSRLLRERKAAIEQLEKARKIYEQVSAQADPYPLLKRRAIFALGKTYESLGQIDKAKKQYEQVVKDEGDGVLAELAQRSLTRLNRPDIPDFYAEVAAYVSPSSPDYDPSIDVLPDKHDLTYPGGPIASVSGGVFDGGSGEMPDDNTRDFVLPEFVPPETNDGSDAGSDAATTTDPEPPAGEKTAPSETTGEPAETPPIKPAEEPAGESVEAGDEPTTTTPDKPDESAKETEGDGANPESSETAKSSDPPAPSDSAE